MSITSYDFYIMLIIAVLIYYLMPIRHRWITLFVTTVVFAFEANTSVNILWTVLSSIVCFGIAIVIEKEKERRVLCKIMLLASIVCVIVCLFLFKEHRFFVNTTNIVLSYLNSARVITDFDLIAPIGISYYSLTLISYVCEVYWGTIAAEKNFFKFTTFSLFFPTLTSGPIMKYKRDALKILEGHSFNYEKFCFGLQRMAWGFFKKLVISERVAVIVNTIYADYYTYNGLYVLLAACAFSLQLYTDFSGCIDIMLGAAELFGVDLPENFELPFLSLTLEEIWRRWHITLGGWLKEYILYPLLKSSLFQKIGSKCKKNIGKKYGKKIPTWIALIISWFLIGFWHGGGYNYIFGVGLFMGIVIILSEMMESLFSKFKSLLRIDDHVLSWKLFQIARTYMLFSFGLSFFRASSLRDGFNLWKNFFKSFNPWIFFDGSLYGLGLSEKNVRLLLVMILILFIGGIIKYLKNESIRILISKQNICFRWCVYIMLVWMVIVFGVYGPNYDASSFIYGNF